MESCYDALTLSSLTASQIVIMKTFSATSDDKVGTIAPVATLHGLTLVPTWISNHMPSKVWDEITYPLLAPLKFRNGEVISSHTL